MKTRGQDWYLELAVTSHEGITVTDGCFGQVRLAKHGLFKLRMKKMETGEELFLTSDTGWKCTDCTEKNHTYTFFFSNCERCPEVSVTLTAACDKSGISWSGEVQNGEA